MVNPLIQRDLTEATSKMLNTNGTFYANLTPIKNLIITSRFGYRGGFSNSESFRPAYYVNSSNYSRQIAFTESTRNFYGYQWENFVNYSHDFGKHNLSAMAGMSFEENNTSNMSATGNDLIYLAENFWHVENIPLTAVSALSGKSLTERNMSYFGRLAWNYDNRYNLQANFRADAFDASKLSTKSRWGYFPSVSAGWTISNEAFMKNVSPDVMSYLKLRASWGINGSVSPLSEYRYLYQLRVASSNGYDFTQSSGTTYSIYQDGYLPNDGLKWEESKQVDIGVDARFLRDRLTFTMDFYHKVTDGLLTQTTPPLGTGATSMWVNAGKVRNYGFEFEVGWRDRIGDFSYSVDANLATVNNKVTQGGRSQRMNGTNIPGLGEYVSYFEEGYPLWYIRGYKVDHIDETTGEAYYKTADGNSSRTPTDDDKVMIANAIPDFTYGITISMAYKGFDLNIFGTGSHGGSKIMGFFNGIVKEMNRLSMFYDDAWSESNRNASRPSPFDQIQNSTYYYISNQAVFSTNYFRIKQIQLGYTIPSRILNKAMISSARIFVSLEDYFTFTKYPGYDPESRGNTTTGMSIDRASYPLPGKISFGLNLSF